MKSIVAAGLAVGLAMAPSLVSADEAGGTDPGGRYWALRGGLTFAGADDTPGVLEFSNGPAGFISYGHLFSSGLSIEGEIGFQQVKADGLFDYWQNYHSVTVNALYEFDLGPVRPYLGAGVGVAVVNAEIFETSSEESAGVGTNIQLMGGAAVPLSRRLDLVADYRYSTTAGLVIFDLAGEIDVHAVTAGLRLRM